IQLKNVASKEREARELVEMQKLSLETQQIELEALSEMAVSASKLKSQFLAVASHEIRTPLNSIIGLSELLLDEALTPKVREYVCTINRAGTSLLSTVNDVLDITKIEAGKMRVDEDEFSIVDLLDEVASLVRPQAA